MIKLKDKMNYQRLSIAANKVIQAIDENRFPYISENSKQSIRNQMIFIKNNADNKTDPRDFLNGNQFTYGVISSKEFASPGEMDVKVLIDNVSKIFDEER